jgi:hypothetical protein
MQGNQFSQPGYGRIFPEQLLHARIVILVVFSAYPNFVNLSWYDPGDSPVKVSGDSPPEFSIKIDKGAFRV